MPTARRGARRRSLLCWAGALLAVSARADGSTSGPTQPPLPQAARRGQAHFSFLGFSLYDAVLWATPGFSLADYARHAFALELTYRRSFTGAAIAERSVLEMRRQPGGSDAQFESWGRWMRQVFPDVHAGERLAGIHHPTEGARFLHNGKPLAALADAEFSRRFFGIWLSEQSSDQRLRDAIAAAPPVGR